MTTLIPKYTQSGVTTVNRPYNEKLSEFISVKDFGAVGDGTTDDSTAFQAAIDYCEANSLGSLYVPTAQGEIYMLKATVYINRGDFTLFGFGGNVNNISNVGYITSDVVGMTLFDYGKSLSNPSSTLSILGLAFKSNTIVRGASTQTCFKFTQADNGPHRAIVLRDSSFIGFYKALWFDTPAATIAPSFVDIQDCNFRKGTYAIKIDDFVFGLRFVANQSEDGASIVGKIAVYAEITNNLLESNSNTIDLGQASEGCLVTIRDNYFEDNTGDFLVKVGGYTAPPNTVTRLGAFYRGSDGSGPPTVMGYQLLGQSTVHYESWGSNVNYLYVQGEILSNSTGLDKGFYVTGTTSSTISANQFVGQNTAATYRSIAMGAVTALTPHGISATCATYTAANTATPVKTIATAGNAGDLIVVSFLVRFADTTNPTGWANSLISIYNQDQSVLLGTMACDITSQFSNEWYIMTGTALASASFTSVTFNITPYSEATAAGAGCTLGGAAGTVYASPSTWTLIRPLYPTV